MTGVELNCWLFQQLYWIMLGLGGWGGSGRHHRQTGRGERLVPGLGRERTGNSFRPRTCITWWDEGLCWEVFSREAAGEAVHPLIINVVSGTWHLHLSPGQDQAVSSSQNIFIVPFISRTGMLEKIINMVMCSSRAQLHLYISVGRVPARPHQYLTQSQHFTNIHWYHYSAPAFISDMSSPAEQCFSARRGMWEPGSSHWDWCEPVLRVTLKTLRLGSESSPTSLLSWHGSSQLALLRPGDTFHHPVKCNVTIEGRNKLNTVINLLIPSTSPPSQCELGYCISFISWNNLPGPRPHSSHYSDFLQKINLTLLKRDIPSKGERRTKPTFT